MFIRDRRSGVILASRFTELLQVVNKFVTTSGKQRCTIDTPMHALKMTHELLKSGVTCIHLAGPLDISGVNEVALKFTAYTSTPRKPVIIDLSQVTLITSMGIGMLIGAAKALRPHKVPVILLNPQLLVEKVIRLAGVDQILPIERDLESALRRITNPI
jgi:anti-sigma B factor antagonist